MEQNNSSIATIAEMADCTAHTTAQQPSQPDKAYAEVDGSHADAPLLCTGSTADGHGDVADTMALKTFDMAVEAAGLSNEVLDLPGVYNWHNNLVAILSVGICRIIEKQRLIYALGIRMPRYAQEPDCQRLVDSFYDNYTDVNAPMSRELRYILSKTSGLRTSAVALDDEMEHMMNEPLPLRLPSLVSHLLSRTPDEYRPAVAHAIFPPLAAHLVNTRFVYVDNVKHEATLMNVLMAGTGAGKSCITAPINAIMSDIRERDKVNIEREKEWKRKNAFMGAKDSQPMAARPSGLVIQEVEPDMTNAALVMRLAEAKGHFLYTRVNEIEQFDSLKVSSRINSHFQIMCLAFDPGNTYGQTRAGISSVCDRVTVRFNWNASTTITKGKRYFRHVLTDGPISRINFSTIAERPLGAPMPVYGDYDADYHSQLRPYIDRLNHATGVITCPEALALARDMIEEDRQIAIRLCSREYDNLSRRANVIAYLKAMVLYIAEGCQWSKEIEDFVRWSRRTDMGAKMHFFGRDIEKAEADDDDKPKPGPKSLLTLLPRTFSREQMTKMYAACGMTGDSQALLRMWKSRGLIIEAPNGTIVKS